jgi:hypothetical protein
VRKNGRFPLKQTDVTIQSIFKIVTSVPCNKRLTILLCVRNDGLLVGQHLAEHGHLQRVDVRRLCQNLTQKPKGGFFKRIFEPAEKFAPSEKIVPTEKFMPTPFCICLCWLVWQLPSAFKSLATAEES